MRRRRRETSGGGDGFGISVDKERFFPPKFWAKPNPLNIAQKLKVLLLQETYKCIVDVKRRCKRIFSSLH